MIFAAGLGTRLKPWTDSHPKALAVVNGKTLLQRNIEYLQQHGIKEVIVNVHHFAEQIIDTVTRHNGWGTDVTISDETDQVLETGGGLQKAAWYFEKEASFVVMNADILTDMDLSAMQQQHNTSNALATLATSNRNSSRYLLFNDRQQLCGWENVQTGEQRIRRTDKQLHQEAFSGIHIISTPLLHRVHQKGKFSMIDVYLSLAGDNDIYSYNHTGSKFLDVGRPESLIQAEKIFI